MSATAARCSSSPRATGPGLLCDVGKVLMEERIELHAAKIMTVGERAEDVFYVTDFDNRPLDAAAAERLQGTPGRDARPAPGRAARAAPPAHEPASASAARLSRSSGSRG